MADYYTDVVVRVEPPKDTPQHTSNPSTSTSNILDILTTQTFDTKTALAALYLWLLFGYLSTMVSCDFQRWMKDNVLVRHFIGIISFFFLFTIIDTSNKTDISIIWLKTIIVYVVFLFMVKSKWYFSVPVLLLLVIDQSLKSHYLYVQNNDKNNTSLPIFASWRDKISYLIYAIIAIGFIAYAVRQYTEFGNEFSLMKLLFHYECSNGN